MTPKQAKHMIAWRLREREEPSRPLREKTRYNPRFKFEDIDADTSTERDRLERQSMREVDLGEIERGLLEFPDE